jgi:hypothetical protein
MTMRNASQRETNPKPSGMNVFLLAGLPQISMPKETFEVAIKPDRPPAYTSRQFASMRGLIFGLSHGRCRVSFIRVCPCSSVVRHPSLSAVRVICG